MSGLLVKKKLLRKAGFFIAAVICLISGFNAVLPKEGGLLSLPWTVSGMVSAEVAARFLKGSLLRLNWGLRRPQKN